MEPSSTRRIARMMMTDFAASDTRAPKLVAELLSKAPALADTNAEARQLALMVRCKRQEALAAVV